MTGRAARKTAERIDTVFKALAEPQRIAILRLVQKQELPAGEIAGHFHTTRQAISQHLRLLANAGLLQERREGTKRLFRVRAAGFGEVRTFIDAYWNNRLASLKREVEKRKRQTP